MKKMILFLFTIIFVAPLISMEPQNAKFFKAIEDSNLDEVNQLIADGINVDIRNNDDDTPLTFAVKIGNEDIIKAILSEVPNIFLANKKGQGAIGLAGTNTVIRSLVDFGRGQFVLYQAVENSDMAISTLQTILNIAKIVHNTQNPARNVLAIVKNKDFIKLLVDRKADPNWVLRNGKTPFMS